MSISRPATSESKTPLTKALPRETSLPGQLPPPVAKPAAVAVTNSTLNPNGSLPSHEQWLREHNLEPNAGDPRLDIRPNT